MRKNVSFFSSMTIDGLNVFLLASYPGCVFLAVFSMCPVPPLEQICALGSPRGPTVCPSVLPAHLCCACSCSSCSREPGMARPRTAPGRGLGPSCCVTCVRCCWGGCRCCCEYLLQVWQFELKPISLANVFSPLFCLGSPCKHLPGEERLGLCSAPCVWLLFLLLWG